MAFGLLGVSKATVVPTGSVAVTVQSAVGPTPVSGRNVTVNGVTQATNGSGQTTFTSVPVGTSVSVVCATPGGETAAWTSTAGTAAGTGFTASPLTVTDGGTTTVVFTLTVGGGGGGE